MSARLGKQAVRLRPVHVEALRTGCRKDEDGRQCGGAVPKAVADYLEEKHLVYRPNEDNPWWVLTTASGAELLCAAEAT